MRMGVCGGDLTGDMVGECAGEGIRGGDCTRIGVRSDGGGDRILSCCVSNVGERISNIIRFQKK